MKPFPLSISTQESFKRQIVLTFVLGFFFLTAVFTVYQVRTESAYLYRESTDDAISLADSLAASSLSWVLTNDVAGLREVVHSFRKHPGLRYAMVISPAGQVLAHSDATKVGQFVSDEQSLALIKSPPRRQIMIDNETLIDIAVPVMAGSRHVGWARAAHGRESITGNLRNMMVAGALFVLMAVVLSLLAALFIANRLGYRIRNLMRVAEAVQAGNYATRASIPGADEIARLANSLNHMLDELARDEEQLQASSLYTRSLIEASLDPLVTISPEGKITDVNLATEKVTGRSRSELIGTDFSDYFTEPDKARGGYQQVFQKGFVTDYPLALRHRDGHVTDVLYNASVYRNEAGEVLGVFAAARDVTERKKVELEREQYFKFFNTSTDLMGIADPNGTFKKVNPAFLDTLGYSEAEILAQPFISFVHPDDQQPTLDEMARQLKTGYSLDFENRYVCKDGSLRWLSWRANVNYAEGLTYATARDITERKLAEEALKSSEASLAEAQRIAHLGSWYLDIATNQVFWSEELYKMYGFDPALPPPLYTESMKLFTPESWERLSNAIARATETGIFYELELETVRKDGGRGWMWARGEPVHDAHGAVVRVRGVTMDITGRKQAEEKIRESEKKFRTLTDTSPLAIYMSSGIEQIAEYINPTFTKLFGYTLEEVPTVAQWWPRAYPDEQYRKQVSEEWQRKVERAIATSSEIEPMEVVVTCKDGSQKNIQWGYISTGLQNWAFGLDLTERKRAEQELRRSEHSLAEAQRIAHMGNWELDLARNVLTWSDEIYRIFEVDPEKFGASYEAFLEAIHPDDREMVNRAYAASLENKLPYNITHRLLMKDGRVKYVTEKCETHYDETGKPLRSIGTVHDITERKQAEDELREKEERLALATFHNGVGIWDWNLVTQKMIWDDSMYALYHIRREDFIGTEEAWRAALHPDDLHRGDKEVADAIADVKPFNTEFRVVWPNGEIRHIKALAKVFRGEQGTPLRMLGINMDITDRKQAEDALREREKFLSLIIENIPDMIFMKEAKELRFVRFNRAGEELLGHKREDLLGKNDYDFFPREQADFFTQKDREALEGGQLCDIPEEPMDSKTGKRILHTKKLPILDADGKPAYLLGISEDITERKKAENEIRDLNRDLERRVVERTAQLEAANKELEAFSYSVSHDLRTPLRAIDGFSHILLEDYAGKLDEEGKRLLNVVRDNAGKMEQLIDDILKFSRAGRLEINFSKIDMEGLAREVYDELLPRAGHELQVEIGHIPPATGDRAMMRQVFVNLLSNAIKFSRIREDARVEVGSSAEGNETVYFVRDNGAGFDMHYADRLFGVFQRLHGVSEFEGTGIGLAIVKRIVTRHGGRVWAEGEVGKGATFYFSMPIPPTRHQP